MDVHRDQYAQGHDHRGANLVPSTDPGLFDLLVDGQAAPVAVGNGGTLGPITVEAATSPHNVDETAHTTASLADYVTSVTCIEDTADGT